MSTRRTDGTVEIANLPVLLDLANSDPLPVAIVDASGNQITTFGGTQYTEDAVAAADPVGGALIYVRKDTADSFTPLTTEASNGDNIALRGNRAGAVYVNLVDDAGNVLRLTEGSLAVVPVVVTPGASAISVVQANQVGTGLSFATNTLNDPSPNGFGDPTILGAGMIACFDDTSPTAISENQFGTLRMSSRRELYGQLRDAAGGERGANVSAENALNVTPIATTAGGSTSYSFISTSAVQAAEIKGSAGQVYGLLFFNNSTVVLYGRIYNQTGTPGTGDAANIKLRFMIPGSTAGAGFVVPLPVGLACGTGIGIRVSGAIADNDATALTANDLIGNVLYK